VIWAWTVIAENRPHHRRVERGSEMTSKEWREAWNEAGSEFATDMIGKVIADLEAAEKERDEWKDSYTSEFYCAERAEALLREARDMMNHAHIFITTRERMAKTGVKLYDALLSRIEEVVK